MVYTGHTGTQLEQFRISRLGVRMIKRVNNYQQRVNNTSRKVTPKNNYGESHLDNFGSNWGERFVPCVYVSFQVHIQELENEI